MDEIDAVDDFLKHEFNKIYKQKKSIRNERGKTGEAFVKNAIKQSFFDKGYEIKDKGNGTFRVRKQVNANNQGRGGIDFYVEFTDENGNSNEILVESKNWGNYSFSNDTYNNEIKDRFDKVDKKNEMNRALAIPKHHQSNKNIIQECPKDNITVIPIEQQILKKTIKRGELKQTFEGFKESFDDYIDGFVPDVNEDRVESLEEDLKQGKEIKVVANKWDVSEGHVRNVYNKLGLPDRRKMPWKTISYIQYEPV